MVPGLISGDSRHPSPRTWRYGPAMTWPGKGVQTGQSIWVPRDGACPETCAM